LQIGKQKSNVVFHAFDPGFFCGGLRWQSISRQPCPGIAGGSAVQPGPPKMRVYSTSCLEVGLGHLRATKPYVRVLGTSRGRTNSNPR
jgi:hypothetical protein